VRKNKGEEAEDGCSPERRRHPRAEWFAGRLARPLAQPCRQPVHASTAGRPAVDGSLVVPAGRLGSTLGAGRSPRIVAPVAGGEGQSSWRSRESGTRRCASPEGGVVPRGLGGGGGGREEAMRAEVCDGSNGRLHFCGSDAHKFS
jgi:hypothetical protein